MGLIKGILIFILIVLFIGYGYYDYHLEKNGQNNEKANFCRNLGYEVEHEISFFYPITCYKIKNGIKTRYSIKTSSTKIGEIYDKEHEYYLKEILW